MRGRPYPRYAWWSTIAALLTALGTAAPALAESNSATTAPSVPESVAPAANSAVNQTQTEILQVGCSTCGGLLGGTLSGCSSCGSGDCASGCYPGRAACGSCCNAETAVGRFFCGLYDCICCPDPCYDPPAWLAVADSAFFVDAARPITQSRIRVDSAWDFRSPDRAEYFLAREATSPNQSVASSRGNGGPGRGPAAALHSIDFEDLSLYTEGATGRVGAFVEIPYREIGYNLVGFEDPTRIPTLSQSGFADMNAGVKTLLLDCELLQLSFQFKTFIPIGQSSKGFGTNHVSLEPAFLLAVKISPLTYFQAETAYWIPIGGDQVYQANIWHSHFSLNHILWQAEKRIQIIGTAELNEWTVYGGAYTLDFRPPGSTAIFGDSGSTSILSVGPGIRAVICDKIDVGVGSAFAITGKAWARDTIRAEVRLRF